METATNYRYIVKTEGVRSGNPRIEGTRIGVHDVVAYFLVGRDVDGIRAAFPDLPEDLRRHDMLVAFVDRHQAEIDLGSKHLALRGIAGEAVQRGQRIGGEDRCCTIGVTA